MGTYTFFYIEEGNKAMNINLDLKYRPEVLEDIVGNLGCKQALEALTLSNAIPKFMIFTGYPGSGKTTTAYIIALALLKQGYADNGETLPDGLIKTVKEDLYTKGISNQDAGIFIYDIGNNSDLEYIQGIATAIKTRGFTHKKIIIIDELQMIKMSYQDPLLKATEFIPDGNHIIITTSEPKKLSNALKDRADLTLDFKYPTTAEALDYIKEISINEGIKIPNDTLKTIITQNKGNLRKILKALSIYNKAPEDIINELYKNKEQELQIYIEFFKAVQGNILDTIVFIEELDDISKFVQGLPIFIKEYIKLIHTSKGYTRKFRTDVISAMSLYEDKILIDIMNNSLGISIRDIDIAETYLLGIAYKLNDNLRRQADEPDNVIYNNVANENRAVDDINMLASNTIIPTDTPDYVGVDIENMFK